jgi:hypothetical protein
VTHRHHPKPGRRGPGLALGALLMLGAMAPAVADARPPRITQAPVVAGTPVVGATLQATGAEWESTPGPTVTWQWMRCAADDEEAPTRRDRCLMPGARKPVACPAV